MLYELFSLRVIQVGVAFFLLFVGGSLLYSWHVHHTTDVHLAETQRSVEVLEKHHPTRTGSDGSVLLETDIQGVSDMSASDEPEMMSSETEVLPGSDVEILDFIDAFLGDDMPLEAAEEDDRPMSPFGFGVLPEVPADFPRQDVWQTLFELKNDMGSEHARKYELINRVILKLWEKGEKYDGGFYSDAKVYPLNDKTIYITWDSAEDPITGEVIHFIGRKTSMPGVGSLYDDQDFQKGLYPPSIDVIQHSEGGYSPYSFLQINP